MRPTGCFFVAAVLSFALVLSLCAQDTADVWIAKLGSRSYLERERVMQSLEALGSSALPALHKAMKHPDQEIRQRSSALIGRIEERMLLDELRAPTMTRFQFHNTPLYEALREIEKQTGLPCGTARRHGRPITVDTGIVPFWQAWDRFCQAAKLEEVDHSRSLAQLHPGDLGVLRELLERWDLPRYRDSFLFDPPRFDFATDHKPSRFAVDDRRKIRVRARGVAVQPLFGDKNLHATFAFELRPQPSLQLIGMPRVEILKMLDSQCETLPVLHVTILPAFLRTSTRVDFLNAYLGEVQCGGLWHQHAVDWQIGRAHV